MEVELKLLVDTNYKDTLLRHPLLSAHAQLTPRSAAGPELAGQGVGQCARVSVHGHETKLGWREANGGHLIIALSSTRDGGNGSPPGSRDRTLLSVMELPTKPGLQL
jgi:hypothetical protein